MDTNKTTGPTFGLKQITAALKRATSPFIEMANAIDKTTEKFEAISKNDAEEKMKRFFRMSALNPKGFRVPSRKHGPKGYLTYPDKLLMAVVGPSQMPKATRSLRKAKKADRYPAYLEAVRNNPKYPTGDRRAKQGA